MVVITFASSPSALHTFKDSELSCCELPSSDGNWWPLLSPIGEVDERLPRRRRSGDKELSNGIEWKFLREKDHKYFPPQFEWKIMFFLLLILGGNFRRAAKEGRRSNKEAQIFTSFAGTKVNVFIRRIKPSSYRTLSFRNPTHGTSNSFVTIQSLSAIICTFDGQTESPLRKSNIYGNRCKSPGTRTISLCKQLKG